MFIVELFVAAFFFGAVGSLALLVVSAVCGAAVSPIVGPWWEWKDRKKAAAKVAAEEKLKAAMSPQELEAHNMKMAHYAWTDLI